AGSGRIVNAIGDRSPRWGWPAPNLREFPRCAAPCLPAECDQPEGPAISENGGTPMPRYMVERTFRDGLHIPMTEQGAATCLGVVDRNADLGVTWVQTYVGEDK